MSAKPFAPAPERNAGPILDILRTAFASCTRVLEIGSGTGQHAVRFGAELGHLSWQTSDLEPNHAGICAWIEEAGLDNVLEPLVVDVLTSELPRKSFDGVFSANTAHIMSFEAVERMLALVGRVLVEGGVFCLYGPFRQNGEFNTESNAAFDRALRHQDPEMGIRDLEDLDRFGADHGLRRECLHAMPANNCLAVWRKRDAARGTPEQI
jgi:SAM-dependent methyltransferase